MSLLYMEGSKLAWEFNTYLAKGVGAASWTIILPEDLHLDMA